MPDAQRAVMRQKMRQALRLVAEAEEAEQVIGGDPGGAVDQWSKLAVATEGPQQKKLAPTAQFQRQKRAGQASRGRVKFADGTGMGQS